MRAGALALAAALALLARAGPAAAGPVAMITDLEGAAWRGGGAARAPAAILDSFDAGATLELAAGTRMALVVFETAAEHRFTGPARLRIGAAEPEILAGAPGDRRRLDVLGANRAGIAEAAAMAEAAIRMRGARSTRLELLSPVATATDETRPVLRWRTVEGASEYRVMVFDDAGAVVHRARTGDGALPVPHALARGAGYRWRVSAVAGDGERLEAEATFDVLDDAGHATLAAAHPAPDASFGERVLHALLLEDLGLREAAREAWRTLSRERPEAAAVRQRAGG